MKEIKDIKLEDEIPSLETIVFDEYSKMGIIPSNSEWRIMKTLSSSIAKYIHLKEQNYNERIEYWLTNEYAKELQNWLIEDFMPSFHKFNYWASKEFPKTFNKMVSNENEDTEENIEEAEYEEVYTNN